jgi:membrane protein YqaA with SNARE-associated domain
MYKGLYHVLMGRLSPLEGIGADVLTISGLLERVADSSKNPGGVAIKEVVLGLNPTLEGDGTALYLGEALRGKAVLVTGGCGFIGSHVSGALAALGADLRRKAERDKGMLQIVCVAIDRDTFWYVLASRLAVVVPFHMINVAAGIMSVRLGPYTVATLIGLLPAHIIYCWIGARLNALLRADPNPDFQALFGQFWAPMAGVFVLAVLLPLVLRTVQARLPGATAR